MTALPSQASMKKGLYRDHAFVFNDLRLLSREAIAQVILLPVEQLATGRRRLALLQLRPHRHIFQKSRQHRQAFLSV
jgi:hypothetical protein